MLDAVLEIVNMSKQNVDRVDTFEGKGCTILPLLHAQGVWRSEFISATRCRFSALRVSAFDSQDVLRCRAVGPEYKFA